MKKIWIDLDNSPHVPLFRPIISELYNRGINVIITAREYAQTTHLLDLWNIDYTKIGRHGGKRKINKIINLFYRALQLRNFIKNKQVDLAICHGSRTQIVAAKLLGIPAITMSDYEYTEIWLFNKLASYILVPALIPDKRLLSVNYKLNKVIRYNGFKEELYLPSFVPDTDFRKRINIPKENILITLRPPAILGNYHDPKSEKILFAIIERVLSIDNIYLLLINRTKEDKEMIINKYGAEINFLDQAVDGLQLIWNSDMFISGGGTMNRESALLGVPTYSFFTGKKPYLDEYLEQKDKMKFIDSPEKASIININKRTINDKINIEVKHLEKEIVDIIISKL